MSSPFGDGGWRRRSQSADNAPHTTATSLPQRRRRQHSSSYGGDAGGGDDSGDDAGAAAVASATAGASRASSSSYSGRLERYASQASELHGFSMGFESPLVHTGGGGNGHGHGGGGGSASEEEEEEDSSKEAHSADAVLDVGGGGGGGADQQQQHGRRQQRAGGGGGVAAAEPATTTTAAGVLDPVPPGRRMTLEWRDVCVFAPVGHGKKPSPAKMLGAAVSGAVRWCGGGGGGGGGGNNSQQQPPRSGRKTKKERQILFGATGAAAPGQLIAMMGPSGSGKTSLLTLLGGRSAMKFTGDVLVNGRPLTKAARNRIGYVLQDDVLYESLTVRETLTYAALLRLPRAWPKADKLARVERVVGALGLRKSRDTIIGGFFRRGISGGERKRVSIGAELLVEPAILLLDEPTSGLDSTTSLHLLRLLRELAGGGRCVLTTLHQPSGRLWALLDRLLLLAEGHTLYDGRADGVAAHFGRFGYGVPFGVGIPDWVLDLAMGESEAPRRPANAKRGMAAVAELWEAWEAGEKERRRQQQQQGGGSGGGGDGGGSGGQQLLPPIRSGAVASFSVVVDDGGQLGANGHTGNDGDDTYGGREGASYWQQLSALLARAAKVRRFESLTGQQLFQLLAVSAITGLIYFQKGQQFYGGLQAVTDLQGLLYFALLFPSMRALFRALFVLPNDYRMLMKERPSGLYQISAYFFARTLSDLPLELFNTALFTLIVYLLGGLKRSAAGFFGFLFSTALVVGVAESWGLFIGGVFMDAKTAQTVTTVIILTFLLVGGFYVRVIPAWIAWLQWLSYLRYGFDLLVRSQFSGVTFYQCATTTTAAGGANGGGCVPLPKAALPLNVDPDASAAVDVVALLAMLVILRVAIYVTLRRKTRVKQKTA